MQELLHHQAALLGGLQHRLVSHEQRAHQLQDGYLEGEVERRDDRHRAERPPVPVAKLTVVIARDAERPRQEPHVVAGEVVQEVGRHLDLAHCLRVRLGDGPLDRRGEEVRDRRIAQRRAGLARNFTVLQIPLVVLERVVQAGLGHGPEAVDERREFAFLCVRDGADGRRVPVERVRYSEGHRRAAPLPGDDVGNRVGRPVRPEGRRVERRPGREAREGSSAEPGGRGRRSGLQCCQHHLATDGLACCTSRGCL
mmetsp:Transcript_26028/g.58646  ORF Transcript_26028/g.58646 Transcript_26028/m.58646 type:complete len:254 (-) Transcript_26028:59-820(-)